MDNNICLEFMDKKNVELRTAPRFDLFIFSLIATLVFSPLLWACHALIFLRARLSILYGVK